MRAVCPRELQPLVDDMWTDGAGNVIGYRHGGFGRRRRDGSAPAPVDQTPGRGAGTPHEWRPTPGRGRVFRVHDQRGDRRHGTGGPIVGYSDAVCVYDKDVADRLMRIATEKGLSPLRALVSRGLIGHASLPRPEPNS